MSESIVLYETDVLGIAYTSVNRGYSGHCALECQRNWGRGTHRAVFPTVDDANAAARFAVGELGGFNRADVFEAPKDAPTHDSWDDWAFSF